MSPLDNVPLPDLIEYFIQVMSTQSNKDNLIGILNAVRTYLQGQGENELLALPVKTDTSWKYILNKLKNVQSSEEKNKLLLTCGALIVKLAGIDESEPLQQCSLIRSTPLLTMYFKRVVLTNNRFQKQIDMYHDLLVEKSQKNWSWIVFLAVLYERVLQNAQKVIMKDFIPFQRAFSLIRFVKAVPTDKRKTILDLFAEHESHELLSYRRMLELLSPEEKTAMAEYAPLKWITTWFDFEKAAQLTETQKQTIDLIFQVHHALNVSEADRDRRLVYSLFFSAEIKWTQEQHRLFANYFRGEFSMWFLALYADDPIRLTENQYQFVRSCIQRYQIGRINRNELLANILNQKDIAFSPEIVEHFRRLFKDNENTFLIERSAGLKRTTSSAAENSEASTSQIKKSRGTDDPLPLPGLHDLASVAMQQQPLPEPVTTRMNRIVGFFQTSIENREEAHSLQQNSQSNPQLHRSQLIPLDNSEDENPMQMNDGGLGK